MLVAVGNVDGFNTLIICLDTYWENDLKSTCVSLDTNTFTRNCAGNPSISTNMSFLKDLCSFRKGKGLKGCDVKTGDIPVIGGG